MKIAQIITLFGALLVSSTSVAFAAETKIGNLTLTDPIARATPPNANVGGGYIKITNNGETSDRLIAITADFAGMAQIHEMKMDDAVMKMNHLEEGLEIASGETVALKPGGYHLMFMRLKEPLLKGEKRAVRLTFENAGEIELVFDVQSLAETLKLN